CGRQCDCRGRAAGHCRLPHHSRPTGNADGCRAGARERACCGVEYTCRSDPTDSVEHADIVEYSDHCSAAFALVREAGGGRREAGSGKREEGRGKREEGRGKREEGSANSSGVILKPAMI